MIIEYKVVLTPYKPFIPNAKLGRVRHIDLPKFIKDKKTWVNVKNKDINYWDWMILSSLFHDKIDDHYDRVSNYNKLTNR